MTVDERTLRESLATYANGVVMSSSDIDRMHTELQQRLGPKRKGSRTWLLIAAAAVLLLVVAVATGTVWLRQTEPAIPAKPAIPQGVGPLPAITFDEDATGSNLVSMRPDGTMSRLVAQENIFDLATTGWTLHWRIDGATLVRDGVSHQGQACRGTVTWAVESDGVIRYDTTVLEGPGCPSPSEPPALSTRLSPASEGGRKLSVDAPGQGKPVTEAVQLNGVWLLQGSGLLLASNEVRGGVGADYRLDDDGDIDTAPDATGILTVSPEGRITLTSDGCAETTLSNVKSTGTNTRSTMTMTVTSDPCKRFGTSGVMTWIKVL